MPSDEAIDKAIKDIKKQAIPGKDVEQKVTDCLQDWAAAGSNAVKELMERQRQEQDAEVARAQFIISLVGNLAWAATVFFPPAAAVVVTKDFFGPSGWSGLINTLESPGPSGATKIVSVLGAAVGSNAIGRLAQPTASLDWTAIDNYLGGLVPDISEKLAGTAKEWINSELASHMFGMYVIKNPDRRYVLYNKDQELQDAQKFKEWCDSYQGGRELRRAVWEKFVFPADGLAFDLGQQGLKEFLLRKLTDLKTKYDSQYKAYMIQISQGYIDYMSRFSNPFNRMTFEEWKKRRGTSFHFVARLEGLPGEFLKVQDQRLREMEFQLTCIGCDRIPVPGAGLPSR